MLMVVFGAGASYDSFAEYPPVSYRSFQELTMPYFELEQRRPPLAAALFHERFAELFSRYPECLGLFPQLRWAADSIGIERRLAELVEEAGSDPVVRQQMLAMRFYIRDAIASLIPQWQASTHNATNYAVLLDRIDRWRRRSGQQVALVTFNYDTLLDGAAVTVLPPLRGGFTTMSHYIERNEYKLLKLHGSTDWRRLIPGLQRRQNSYQDAMAYAAEHPIPMVDTLITEHDLNTSVPHVDIPAIAIPVQEKSDFELPEPHKYVLRKCIDATTDLIIVGWRGMERHFLDLWVVTAADPPLGPPHLKRVLIVDKGEGAQVVEGQLRAGALMDFDRISLEILTDGFSAFLRSDGLEAFLSQVLAGVPQV
jgi:hypothetical protein